MLPIPPGVYHRLGHRRQCPLRKLSSTKKRARRMSLVGTKLKSDVAPQNWSLAFELLACGHDLLHDAYACESAGILH